MTYEEYLQGINFSDFSDEKIMDFVKILTDYQYLVRTKHVNENTKFNPTEEEKRLLPKVDELLLTLHLEMIKREKGKKQKVKL